MAKKKDDLKDGNIIDLDADQVFEHVEKPTTDEPSAPSVEEQMKPIARKSLRSGLAYPALALIAGVIAGGWFYKDVLADYFPSDRTKALTEKIDVIEKGNANLREQIASLDRLSSQVKADVDALESKDGALSATIADVQSSQSAANEKLASLEQNIADVKKTMATMAAQPSVGSTGTVDASALVALRDRIDTIERDIVALKAKPVEPPDNTVMLTRSLTDMKVKVAAGAPFMDDLLRIQRLVPAASGVETLQQHAAAGLPDTKGLSQELKALIGDLPKPIVPGPVPESEGWWSWIVDGLSDIVSIRVEGEADWPTAASAAAALAESGDLPQAMEQLNAVQDAKPPGIQQWLERAQARLDVDKAVQSIEEAVLRDIAAKAQQ
jgi:hypothetical protein